MADDVWIYDFETKKTEQLTNDPAQDIIPMWDGRQDLLPLRPRRRQAVEPLRRTTSTTKQTQAAHALHRLRHQVPVAGRQGIVFENGGYIYKLRPGDGEGREGARSASWRTSVGGRGGLHDVSKNVANFEISPDGKRALFGARGDVFTVPAEDGPTRNLTNTPGVHDRNAEWSPDGKQIAFISDATGEDEIWIDRRRTAAASRRSSPRGGDTYKYELHWSPDSKKILWADKKLRLQYVDVATKKVTQVDQAKAWEIRDFVWSPDSKWIAYARPEEDGDAARSISTRVEQDKATAVTDGWYASRRAGFSGDGKYLFFVSARDFNPIYSATEWNHAYHDMRAVYFVTLAKETPSPFKPKSDEVETRTDPKPTRRTSRRTKPKRSRPIEGRSRRPRGAHPRACRSGRQLPQPAVGRRARSTTSAAAARQPQPALHVFDLAAQEGDGARQRRRLRDLRRRQEDDRLAGRQVRHHRPAQGPDRPSASRSNLSGMEMKLDRKAEWKQIFNECWRQMRDFFYDPDMHGVDWPAMQKKYEPLVAARQPPGRSDLRHRRDDRRAERRPRLRRRRRHAEVEAHAAGPARGRAASATRRPGYFQIAKILHGRQLGPDAALAADRDRASTSRRAITSSPIDGKPTNEMDEHLRSCWSTRPASR